MCTDSRTSSGLRSALANPARKCSLSGTCRVPPAEEEDVSAQAAGSARRSVRFTVSAKGGHPAQHQVTRGRACGSQDSPVPPTGSEDGVVAAASGHLPPRSPVSFRPGLRGFSLSSRGRLTLCDQGKGAAYAGTGFVRTVNRAQTPGSAFCSCCCSGLLTRHLCFQCTKPPFSPIASTEGSRSPLALKGGLWSHRRRMEELTLQPRDPDGSCSWHKQHHASWNRCGRRQERPGSPLSSGPPGAGQRAHCLASGAGQCPGAAASQSWEDRDLKPG